MHTSSRCHGGGRLSVQTVSSIPLLRGFTRATTHPSCPLPPHVVDSRPSQVAVRELPCVVESFKTYDGANLVKSNDIGQILVRAFTLSVETQRSGSA